MTTELSTTSPKSIAPRLSKLAAIPNRHIPEKANSIEYGLSCAIFTQDVNRAFHAIRDLETGLCYVNHSTIGAEISLPFGGMKGTGNGGREAAWTALDTFTEWKSVYVDWSGTLQRAQIDNR